MNRRFSTMVCLLVLVGCTAFCGPIARAGDPKPEDAFPVFKQDMETALRGSGKPDPQSHNYHFVLLLNTVRTSGSAWKAIRAISDGMLGCYMVPGDRVSLVLFQNNVWNHSDWGLPYGPDTVTKVKNLYGPGPVEPEGGNDQEKALLAAVQATAGSDGVPGDIVYIVLTDDPCSQPPRGLTESALTENQPWFKASMEKAGLPWNPEGQSNIRLQMPISDADAAGNPVTTEIYYDFYYSKDTESGTDIKGSKSRDQIAGGPQPPLVATITPHGGGGPPPPPPIDPSLVVVGVLALIIVAGLAGYVIWLVKPRGIKIGPSPGQVKYGKPTYVIFNNDTYELTQKASGNRVAAVEVSAGGGVFVRGQSFYLVNPGKKYLNYTATTVRLIDQRAAGKESHEFTASLIR